MSEEVLRQADEHKAEIDRMLAIPSREIERIEHARKVALRFHITTVLLVIAGIVGVALIAIDNGRTSRASLALEHNRVIDLEQRVAELGQHAADREVTHDERVADLEETILDLEAEIEARDLLIGEATAFIGALAQETAAHGGDPGLLQLDGIIGGPVDDPPGPTGPEDS